MQMCGDAYVYCNKMQRKVADIIDGCDGYNADMRTTV